MNKLSKLLEQYLTIRRQLGFELRDVEFVLKGFVLYVEQKKKRHIIAKIALEFATKNQKCTLPSQAAKLGIIRRFALYVRTFDAKTEVPSKELLPCSYHRRLPYIFSDGEIIRILETCQELWKENPLCARSYYTFFGLIAVTGMRSGEVLALCRDAVDLKQGIITITESKYRKTRKIPIHSSTTKVLKQYSEFRDRHLKKKSSEKFFIKERGHALTPSVRNTFKKVCLSAGINIEGKFPPRLLDFRHTFAVKTLVNCYKTGVNPNTILPTLSMYLGQENPKNTYWYLTATPELMGLIVNHLEKKYGGK